MSEESALDDFMEGIGLDVKAKSAEDALMIRITAGGHNELSIFRYWLMHEMHHYYDMLEAGVQYMRFSQIKQEHVPLTKEDYVNIRTKYYLRMKYHPYFQRDVAGLGIANLNEMAKLLMAHDHIVSMVNKKRDELPKLHY